MPMARRNHTPGGVSVIRVGDGLSALHAAAASWRARFEPLTVGITGSVGKTSMKEAVAEGRIGRPFHARTWQASYLPGWHPWEDYRTSYAAREDLGGGVVRTLDHDLDMVRWTMGQPIEVLASASSAALGLSVEDTADMVFRLEGVELKNVQIAPLKDGSGGLR